MRILLHIGAWKTGSSAIQRFLVRNREELADRGLCIPDATEKGRDRSVLVGRLASLDPGETGTALEQITRAVEGRGPSVKVAVSCEHFWQLSPEQVARVAAALHQLTQDVSVILYLRPQDDMWNSIYCQQAKSFRVSREAAKWGTDDFISRNVVENGMYYHRCLMGYAAAFGQDAVSARIYRRDRFRGGDVVRDFMDRAGVDDRGLSAAKEHTNVSFGWKGVAMSQWAIDALGVQSLPEEIRMRARKAFRSSVATMAEETGDRDWQGGTAQVLSTEDRRRIRDHYAADNARLFADFFGGEDVFGAPREVDADQIDADLIPAAEFKRAARILGNRLANRGVDIGPMKTLAEAADALGATSRKFGLLDFLRLRGLKN